MGQGLEPISLQSALPALQAVARRLKAIQPTVGPPAVKVCEVETAERPEMERSAILKHRIVPQKTGDVMLATPCAGAHRCCEAWRSPSGGGAVRRRDTPEVVRGRLSSGLSTSTRIVPIAPADRVSACVRWLAGPCRRRRADSVRPPSPQGPDMPRTSPVWRAVTPCVEPLVNAEIPSDRSALQGLVGRHFLRSFRSVDLPMFTVDATIGCRLLPFQHFSACKSATRTGLSPGGEPGRDAPITLRTALCEARERRAVPRTGTAGPRAAARPAKPSPPAASPHPATKRTGAGMSPETPFCPAGSRTPIFRARRTRRSGACSSHWRGGSTCRRRLRSRRCPRYPPR